MKLDSAAERALIAKYIGLVKWVARRVVPDRDQADAVQDGLWAVIETARSQDDDQPGRLNLNTRISHAIRWRIIDGQRDRTGSRRSGHSESVPFSAVLINQPDDDGHRITLGDTIPDEGAEVDNEIIAVDLEQYLRTHTTGDATNDRILQGLMDGRTQQDMADEEGVTASRIAQRVRDIREILAARLLKDRPATGELESTPMQRRRRRTVAARLLKDRPDI